MTSLRPIAFAALLLGAWLGMGSLEQGRIGFVSAEAAQGCGPGFHRGPSGYCRPNYYGGYYGPRYYGYRRGYYGPRGRYYGGSCAKGVASPAAASAAGGFMLGAALLVWAAVPGGDAVLPKGLEQNPVKSGPVSTCGTGSEGRCGPTPI
jgi:hypothetical protein